MVLIPETPALWQSVCTRRPNPSANMLLLNSGKSLKSIEEVTVSRLGQ